METDTNLHTKKPDVTTATPVKSPDSLKEDSVKEESVKERLRTKYDDSVNAVKDRISTGKEAISTKIDNATTSVGDVVESRATAARDATTRAFDSIASSGHYLSESNTQTLTQDIIAAAKKRPLLSLGLAAGVGILIGRMFKR